MRRALELAASVRASTSPNPWVGCVIDGGGLEGATEPPGGRHAEIVALDAAGDRARGATMAWVQGGVRPWKAHGSRVHTSVAPCALSPAAASATASAWGPPGGWVAPSNPPGSITHPTHGLGEVEARTEAASSIARCMVAWCIRLFTYSNKT